MADGRTLLAIDIGTSRLRACLFDTAGELLEQRTCPTGLAMPQPGTAVLDADALWRDLVATVNGLGRGRAAVVAIGVAAQLGLVLLDRDGIPVGPAILWGDMRAAAEAEALDAAAGAEVRQIARRHVAPELTGPRWQWLRRHRPEAVDRARRLVSLKDFVVARLTGEILTDETHASYSGLFDVAERRWSDRLCQLATVDPAILPPVRPAVTPAGRLRPDAAAALGLPAAAVVAVGASDGTSGLIGAGAVVPGVTVDVAGTTDVLLHTVAAPVDDRRGITVLNAHAAPGLWTIGGPTGLTGGAVDWMARILGYASVAAAKAGLAGRRDGEASGALLFRPALGGSRFPDWRARERGVLAGIGLHHGPADLLGAAEEGAALTVAHGLEALTGCGIRPSALVVVGGLADDPSALQLRADATGLPVLKPKLGEASAAGAAMLAGVAARVFSDLAAATACFVRYDPPFEPDPDRTEALRDARARWVELGTGRG